MKADGPYCRVPRAPILLGPSVFAYTPAANTDIRKTFERLRKQQQAPAVLRLKRGAP